MPPPSRRLEDIDPPTPEQKTAARRLTRAARRSNENMIRRRFPYVTCAALALIGWLSLFWPIERMSASLPYAHGLGVTSPLALAGYDIVLAFLAVLLRAFSSAKTGALPFLARVLAPQARQRPRIFVVAHPRPSGPPPRVRVLWRALCHLPDGLRAADDAPVVDGPPRRLDDCPAGQVDFSEVVNNENSYSDTSTLGLLLSHVLHLHGLFHGLNLTVSLSHFSDLRDNHKVVYLPHFRLYWFWLHLTTSADVLLQPLVDRRLLPHGLLPYITGASVVPACLFALPVLAEHVSVHGAAASFMLWWGREHRAFSNFLLSLAFTEIFEVVTLLANRYSLVDD